MATSRVTVGAVLGAVETTATTLTNTLNALNMGVNMINASVKEASENQQDQQKIDRSTFRKNLLRESAQAETEANLKALAFCKTSKDHAALYETAYNEFASLFSEA